MKTRTTMLTALVISALTSGVVMVQILMLLK